METAETEFVRCMKKEIEDRGLSWEYNYSGTEIGIFEGNGNKKVGWISIAKDSAFFYDGGCCIEECCVTPFARVWFNEHGYLPTMFVQPPRIDKEEVMKDTKVSESYIPQAYFENGCKEKGFTIDTGMGKIFANKCGQCWLTWKDGVVSCYDDKAEWSHDIRLIEELKDALDKINSWIDKQTSNKSDIMKEMEDVTNTDNYHGVSGQFEPIKLMEHFSREYQKRNIPVDKGMLLAIALKYLTRVGTKDDYEKEIFKVINFATRALYGKWLPADFDKKMKESE